MSLVLVSTPGSASANSYCTVAEADTYHEARLHSTVWTGSVTATKTTALVMATRLLDTMYEWIEFPTTTTQALAWPRIGILASNQLENVGDTEIPVELKNAVAEFARQLISADRSLDSDIETQGISSLSAGPVSLSFKDGVTAKVVPDAVVNLIPSWWGRCKGRGIATKDVVRA